jgi:predicted NAD/FAD-binding protein
MTAQYWTASQPNLLKQKKIKFYSESLLFIMSKNKISAILWQEQFTLEEMDFYSGSLLKQQSVHTHFSPL